uniref:Palmitoyltransferase n=1 Tax=Oncorhynchus mykiss TaxID=8022 RepID=A0A8C7RRX8_ONCMY
TVSKFHGQRGKTEFGILDRCKELMEAGYNVRQPDKENVSLLHWAAINNHAEVVKYYISKGAVIDQLGGDLNSTPLHWAIRQGHLSMVIQLLRYGADPSVADGEGYRSLHLAILFQHMPIAAYLMAKGQEVDLPDSNGQTPLMLAAQKIIGPEPTNFLMKCNASVSAVDKVDRNSPLHCAVLAGNVDAAHILLEAGASVDAENANVRSPIHTLINPIRNDWITPTVCGAMLCPQPVSLHGPSATVQVLFTVNATALLYYYLRSCRTDPGIVKATEEEKKMNVVLLAEAGCLDPSIFCTSCMMKKPMRASHCFSCDACVAKQDHHSIWINGCIGARNHHFFVLFLLYLCLMGAWMFYGCLVYWSKHCPLHYQEEGVWGAISALVGCSSWVLGVFCLAFFHTSWASILLVIQLYQIAFYGLTNAEMANLVLRQRKLPQSISLRQNPYNLGVVRNLVSFFQLRCCGLFKPAMVDWTQQYPPGRDHMFGQPDIV